MRELARSRNFVVVHEYEAAFLRLPDGRLVPIGHYYGDPVCGLIDHAEKFCVVAGCGLLVYFIREPFQPVDVFPSDQWAEFFRCGEDERWIEAVYQPADDVVRFVVEPQGRHGGVYELCVPALTVEKLVVPLE